MYGQSVRAWLYRYQTERDTPCYKAWHVLFCCKTQGMFCEESRFSDLYPRRASDNQEFDYHQAKTYQDTKLTVIEMANIFHQGGDLIIANPEVNNQKIYEIICDYLQDSIEYNGMLINGRGIDTAHLKELDAFAFAVYPKTRPFLRSKGDGSAFDQFVREMSVFENPELALLEVGHEHQAFFEENKVMSDTHRQEGLLYSLY